MCKKYIKKIITSVLICSLVLETTITNVDAKTYNQSGNALKGYVAKDYHVVNNNNYTRKRYKYKYYYDAKSIKITKGYKKNSKFTRYWMLKNSIFKGKSTTSPQSICVTPDGRIAYILVTNMYSANKENNWTGRIYKVDILKKKLLKKGPKITTGHGQAMGYNPKTKQLWFSNKNKEIKTNLVQVSTKTLKIVKTINFVLSSTVRMGNNLTFDKKGRVYFYTRSAGKWGAPGDPVNNIKIYRGRIHKKSVSFSLIMQGIKNPPGQIGQSLGYNPKSNRLYLVDDGEIISVPVSKLGHLKKKDVRTSVFGKRREFEGLSFDKKGNGYFLTNKPYEIMKTCKGF